MDDMTEQRWLDGINRRETGLVEHACKHGVGHPNKTSIARQNDLYETESYGIHGCDGCCSRLDFPGSVWNSLIFTANAYLGGGERAMERDLAGYLKGIDPKLTEILREILSSINVTHPVEDQMRESFLYVRKLTNYLHERDEWWFRDVRATAEFIYWPLHCLNLPNALADMYEGLLQESDEDL